MQSKYKPSSKTKKWGLGIFLFSAVAVMTGLSAIASGQFDAGIGLVVSYTLFGAFGFYLWTASAPSEYFEKRTAEKQRQADGAIQAALERLDDLSGVKAVLAVENLESLVRKAYKKDAGKKISELLDSIGFDRSRIESKYIGAVTYLGTGTFGLGSGQVRIYKDWVIADTLGFDFDVSTRGEVTMDGSIQYGKNNQKIDNRKAALHLATQDWSHSFSILPDQADEARRLLNQLNAIVEQMKPKAVSAAEIAEAMEKLMNASGKSPAEKLEELSNLRYQRLLSDKEFELAKEKILGI